MSDLNTYFQTTISAGDEFPLEAPQDRSTILTQCSVENNGKPYKRAILSAHVETLPVDLLEKDPEAPSEESFPG